MLQAMNTGHDGSISTVHANTTRDALTVLKHGADGTAKSANAGDSIQIVAALDVIVQVERMRMDSVALSRSPR